jgi:hypothetical protein
MTYMPTPGRTFAAAACSYRAPPHGGVAELGVELGVELDGVVEVSGGKDAM